MTAQPDGHAVIIDYPRLRFSREMERLVNRHAIAPEPLALVLGEGGNVFRFDADTLAVDHLEVRLGTALHLLDGELVTSQDEQAGEITQSVADQALIESGILHQPLTLLREFGNSTEDRDGDLEILAALVAVGNNAQHGIGLAIELAVANHNDGLFELVEGDDLTINEFEGQTLALTDGLQLIESADEVGVRLVGLSLLEESADEEGLLTFLQSDGTNPSVGNICHNVRN